METNFQSPLPTPKKKTSWQLVSLVILLLGATGAFAYQNYQLKQQLDKQQPTPSSQLVVSSTTQLIDSTESLETYTDLTDNFSFKYPQDLKPLELSNGVVTFLPKEVYESCKAAQGSKDINAFDPCYSAKFNFYGYKINPPESYEKFIEYRNSATLSKFTDEKNRTWETVLEFGQVYNFDAFTQINNSSIQLSFQYASKPANEKEVLTFFNQILSTFQFID